VAVAAGNDEHMKTLGFLLLGCVSLLAACSSSNDQPGSQTGTGGSPSFPGAGGAATQGPGAGGVAPSAGATGNAGVPVIPGGTGGIPSGSGGAPAGGAPASTGGVGQPSSGGNPSSGGTTSTGGTSSGGSAGAAGTVTMPTTPLVDAPGCGSAKLAQVPDDASAAGPWPVGVRTVKVTIPQGTVVAEIWYPGKPGSEVGAPAVTYDLRDWLLTDKKLIPDAENKLVPCNGCARDIPIDDAHGPYPGVIFVHGTGSLRIANLTTMVTWASRGFVVVAADHPSMYLTDFIGCNANKIAQDLPRDVTATVAAMTGKTGDFAFLGTSIDMSRIGISGHSQGGGAAASLATQPNVQVDMPLAPLGGTAPVSTTLKSTLVAAGQQDTIVTYPSDQQSYSGTNAATKRLVGIAGGDHLNVTDLCWEKNDMGKNSIEVGLAHNVCGGAGINLLNLLFKCGTVDPNLSIKIINYVTTAALEETLHCQDRTAVWSGLKTMFPAIGDYQHAP
jgi:predicted dienelactone hydrolase